MNIVNRSYHGLGWMWDAQSNARKLLLILFGGESGPGGGKTGASIEPRPSRRIFLGEGYVL